MDNSDFSWLNHPSLKNIDAAKLQMLVNLASQGQSKSKNELLPFLMAAASQSKQNGALFSQAETAQILEALKQGKSPAEAARIDQMVQLIRQLRPNS